MKLLVRTVCLFSVKQPPSSVISLIQTEIKLLFPERYLYRAALLKMFFTTSHLQFKPKALQSYKDLPLKILNADAMQSVTALLGCLEV